MEIKQNIKTKDGERQVKVQMPEVGRILNAIRQRGMFLTFRRLSYQYDLDAALQIVEAIGKARTPRFVIDDENKFAYTNFIKWCHGDPSIQAIDPVSRQAVPGNLKKGIYIAGNTGSGKSWCLEIMLAYSAAWRFGIFFADDEKPRPLYWQIERADAICDKFAETGSIIELKKRPMLGIQDLGQEPQESLYMGNRVDVVRQLIEYRGDRTDELTFITSNMKINGEVLMNRYGDRVASRLMEMCNYYEIKGKDRRRL